MWWMASEHQNHSFLARLTLDMYPMAVSMGTSDSINIGESCKRELMKVESRSGEGRVNFTKQTTGIEEKRVHWGI